MTPEDLAALYQSAFADSRGWSAQEFTELLASPFCFVVGGENGFAIGRVIADEAELLTIATHPPQQRTGFGRQSLLAFQTHAAARGATTVFLEVAADNTRAIALYESEGWAQTALRKRYYARSGGIFVDALILTRSLP
ncbi:ribosomal-protein-alanine N-acetyltransferase [Shimia gijangensis]|uniref:Ribosomal-protein-alanine N-acetyltransferase n=1 Tax=Shimia gijangensis TaxID=1470563 RepID=A0A1M6FPR7_9RHOB|nr:GNAT family N-acetyltransferase [Shimia gijangensis]SHI99579.1 ribosomal-protein-alanine N-acetyltransferase [Shimia gijangensis]